MVGVSPPERGGVVTAFQQVFAEAILPPPQIPPDEWSDENIILPSESAAEPGPYRTSRTPYVRQILRDLDIYSGVKKVTVVAGSQLGKSAMGLNWLFYLATEHPSPVLGVFPNLDDARDFGTRRISKIEEASPSLTGLFGSSSGRKATDTKTDKEFPGGSLALRGSNSPSGLASMPIRFLLLEERDRHSASAGDEGDPGAIAEARLRTYASAKIYENSTPTLEGKSQIWESFTKAKGHKYHVRCPHCDHPQELVFEQLKWGEESTHPDGRAEYECVACHEHIQEEAKARMLPSVDDGGTAEWVVCHDGPDDHHGYHISSLYSPLGWMSWNEIAEMWETAEGNPLLEQTFFNTVLGLCYSAPGEQLAWEVIFGRREKYKQGVVPAGACVLTAGVDVQEDRLEVEVVGWGEDNESWSVDYQIIYGSPWEQEVWEELERYRVRPFEHEHGGELQIDTMYVDSGYATSQVYQYCRGKHPTQLLAVKGSASLRQALGRVHKVDIRVNNQTIPGGAMMRRVGVDVLKAKLYGWLRMPVPEEGEGYPPGWCHFPEYGREWCEQITAEKMVSRVRDGQQAFTFEKVRKRNEALDCRVYAMAAAESLGIWRWPPKRWETRRHSCTTDANSVVSEGVAKRYSVAKRDSRGRRKGPEY